MLDLGPTSRQMAELLHGVRDDQLAAPTPCEDYRLGDLIDHVSGLTLAFTRAAAKDIPPGGTQGASGDMSRLGNGWRERIAADLDVLADAWRDEAAWAGMTQAGGVDLPGDVAGQVALNELVLHSWDVASASDQRFEYDPAALEASLEFVSATPDDEESRAGLFGPVVPVPSDAPMLHRVLGLSGRDPNWSPAR